MRDHVGVPVDDNMIELAEQLAKERCTYSVAQAEAAGLSRNWIRWLRKNGRLWCIGAGWVMSDEFGWDFVCAAQNRVEGSVLCLESALEQRGLLKRAMDEPIVLAVEKRSYLPRIHGLDVKLVQMSRASFEYGVEERQTRHGKSIRVYSLAKTLADCLKFRLPCAEAALDRAIAEGKVERAELEDAARVCRVRSSIRRYL